MKYGGDWNETDPFALELAREVFSAPWPPGLGLGAALPGPALGWPEENFALEELPSRTSTDSSSQEKPSSPQENGSPRAASSWAETHTGFHIDPLEVREGRLDVPALNRNEAFVLPVLPLVGQTDLHTRAACCLPEHDHPAQVTRSRDCRFLYCCATGGKGRALTYVYAAKTSGEMKIRSEDVYFLWTLRMAVEAGCLVPALNSLPPLAEGAGENTRMVYDGLAGYLAVRRLTRWPFEFEFTKSFVADWCGITLDAARAGIESIRDRQIIEMVGVAPNRAYLYRVGGSK